MSKATGKRLKFAGGVLFSKFHLKIQILPVKISCIFFPPRQCNTYSPPNSCMPNKANINMNKNNRKRRLIIERILLSNEMTKFLSEDQYLSNNWSRIFLATNFKIQNYLVTLNIRKSLKERSTEMPNDWSGLINVIITSNMLPTITFKYILDKIHILLLLLLQIINLLQCNRICWMRSESIAECPGRTFLLSSQIWTVPGTQTRHSLNMYLFGVWNVNIFSSKFKNKLTEKVAEPSGLIVVLNAHA